MVNQRQNASLPNIGKQELVVLQFVHANAPVSVRKVADHFSGAGKARTTILTVMERLREKGLLEREKSGGSFQYRAAIESHVVMKSLVKDFVQSVLGGSLAPFMAYMSEASELSDEEVQELKSIVSDLETQNKNSNPRGKSK